jgi:hypothetical protein
MSRSRFDFDFCIKNKFSGLDNLEAGLTYSLFRFKADNLLLRVGGTALEGRATKEYPFSFVARNKAKKDQKSVCKENLITENGVESRYVTTREV